MISYPHLSTILLYDMSRRWIQYLNRCMAASDSEVVEAPGAIIPFSLSPVLVDLERGIYLGPILPEPLADLIAGQRALGGNIRSVGDPCGGTRSVCSGGKPKKYRVGAAAGAAGGAGTYPPCHFGKGRTHGPSWKGKSSPPCMATFFVRTGIYAGCDRRNVRVKNSPPQYLLS